MKSVRTGSIRMTIQMKTTTRITIAMAMASAVSQSGISSEGSGSERYPVSVMTSIFVDGKLVQRASVGDETLIKSSIALPVSLRRRLEFTPAASGASPPSRRHHG